MSVLGGSGLRQAWRDGGALAGGPLLGLLAAAGGLLAAGGAVLLSGAPLFAGLALAGGAVAGIAAAHTLAGRGDTRRLQADLVDRSPMPGCATDAAGRLLYANAAWRALGSGEPAAPAALFAGAPWLDDVVREAAAAAAAVRVAPLGRGEARRWYEVLVEPLGGPDRILGWRLRDITETRRMTAEWEAERAHLIDFLNGAPTGFYAADEAGRLLLVNDTLSRWSDLGEAAGAAELWLADLFGTDAERLRPDPAVTPAGTTRRLRAVLRGPDGTERPVEVSETVAPDPSGGGLTTRSVVRDMSEQRAWETALGAAEARFRRFFDAAPVPALTVDAQGLVLEANPAFRALLAGADPAGQPFLDLVRAEDRRDVMRRLTEARRGQQAGEGVEGQLSAEAGSHQVQLFAAPLGTGEGGTGEVLVNLIETTQQRNLEMQFAQSQKMQAIGQLAGGVAHDFNNLLTAMIGHCDLLLLRARPGDEFFPDIMQVKQNANRAANLVRQLLAFSRKQTLRPKELLLTDVLAELAHLLRRLIGDGIELRLRHGRDLGLVMVDQNQFEQVVINLAVNARDAMEEGGVLEITTRNVSTAESREVGSALLPEGEYVLLEVRDTGKGIAPEDLGKIFEPFFTTKKPEGGAGSGTGLGLSTVYGIVKQTGGAVFPESTVGVGTVFRVYLPMHRPEAGRAPVPDLAEGPGRRADLTGKGTILLAEDEDAVRVFAVRALRNKGYTVLEASGGLQALDILERQGGQVDLLISDVMMPQMDGPSLMREVRKRWPNIKVIFISGYAEEAFRRQIDMSHDFDMLPKPFSLKQLAAKVKDVIEGRTD